MSRERRGQVDWRDVTTPTELSRAIDFLFEVGADDRGLLGAGPIASAIDEAQRIQESILEGYAEDVRLYRPRMRDLGGPCPSCGHELQVAGDDVHAWVWCDACRIAYHWEHQ